MTTWQLHPSCFRGRVAAPLSPARASLPWFVGFVMMLLASAPSFGQQAEPPYPPSRVIAGIGWQWGTRQTAAPGSDLWPVTWAADDNLYAAWGDGGGFGGTDGDGRVALGFARIEGTPEHHLAVNVNGGKSPEHPASFARQGKVGGMLAIKDRLYAWLNMQNGKFPDVDQALIWSDDHAASWRRSDWVFAKGRGNLKPGTFLNFGKGHTGLPADVEGYAYFYAPRQRESREFYLGRAPADRLVDRGAYEFFRGRDGDKPLWSSDPAKAAPVFIDARGMNDLASVVYLAALKRYLLTCYHSGPGELGIFDAPHPWGPWTTVAYESHWADMGRAGEGLTCTFPAKWISPDNLSLWCVFSVYGEGAKQGIKAHDSFNLVKATLQLRSPRAERTESK